MLTGSEYKASLQDGRRVSFQGRLITDLAAEPGLATPLDAIAGKIAKAQLREPFWRDAGRLV
jgi:4-hydroxybutyryl-CoA dehydratase / vinylacetyl-CoA-Delta-isomerase